MEITARSGPPSAITGKTIRRLLYLLIFAFPVLAAAANSTYILIFLLPPALMINAVIFHALLKTRRDATFHLARAMIGAILTVVVLVSDSTTEFYPQLLALLSWFLASSACLRLRDQENSRGLIGIFAALVAATSVVCAVAVFGVAASLVGGVAVNRLYVQVLAVASLLLLSSLFPGKKHSNGFVHFWLGFRWCSSLSASMPM